MSDLFELFHPDQSSAASIIEAADTGCLALQPILAALVAEDDRRQRDLLRMVADQLADHIRNALERLRLVQMEEERAS